MGIIESVQQYDLNIPAGGAQNIDVAGDRIQFLSATDPFAQIEIRPNYAQGNISLKPGQGFRFSEQVTRWVVFNRGTVALSGYLMIGSGDFFDQRIAGTVDVIDGGKARTLGGSAFWTGSTQPAVAGQYSHMQLWNPAGSGKIAYLERFEVASDVTSFVGVAWAAAVLSTLAGGGMSKMLGGSTGGAKLYRQASVAIAAGGGQFSSLQVPASVMLVKSLTEPIAIPPGYGLTVFSGVPNVNLTASFEWYEEIA